MTPTIPTISSAFDSGAIEVVSSSNTGPAADFLLHIRKDSHADFRQWFHFRLSDARGLACTLRFENAGACTYPEGWTDYRASHPTTARTGFACRRATTAR